MSIDGNTQLFGVLGWPVGHSLSPTIHNTAAADLGLNLAYLPLAVAPDALPDAVRGLVALGFRGANVTVPHKQTVMPLLDDLSADARAIGAVNTIVVAPDKRLIGHNTDWSGFLADLASLGVPLAGRDSLVLGAGGSSRAIVYALLRAGAGVYVLARRLEQAATLATELSDLFPDQPPVVPGTLDELDAVLGKLHAPLIVNTTPLGMHPHTGASPLPDDLSLPRGSIAYDLVYTPATTLFMQQAARCGARTANGLGMLVQQAAQAFTLWTGRQPDTARMRAAAGDVLASSIAVEE